MRPQIPAIYQPSFHSRIITCQYFILIFLLEMDLIAFLWIKPAQINLENITLMVSREIERERERERGVFEFIFFFSFILQFTRMTLIR